MTDWRHKARCRNSATPDMFWPTIHVRGSNGAYRQAKARAEAAAKAVCARCPVTAECLRLALEFPSDGIFAGTNADDRRTLRKVPR